MDEKDEDPRFYGFQMILWMNWEIKTRNEHGNRTRVKSYLDFPRGGRFGVI